MSLPDAVIIVQDGQLGQVPPSVANASVKVGICSDGVVGQIYSANDNGTAQTLLGQGPLVDAMAQSLSVAGGPCYGVPITPSAVGTASAVATPIHLGAGTVAVTFVPRQAIAVKITLGGTNGTATIAFALGGGTYGASTTTTGGTFAVLVPGTLTTVTLAAAQTWVIGDVYTIGTDGSVTLSGSGPAATNVTQASSPLDAYSVQLAITTAGAIGVAQFTYSLDGGDNISGQILVPSSPGKYTITNTGVQLTFASTFTAGDTYTFTTSTAGFSNSDITTALTLLNASATDYGFVHIVGANTGTVEATVTNATAATAVVIDTAMTAAFVSYRFVFAVMEAPTTLSTGVAIADSALATSFASTVAVRVGVCVGDVELVSPLNGRILRRNFAWAYTARLALIPAGEDPAWVGRGALPNVVSLYRDEQKTPALDAARFVTSRTFPGRAGYYVTNGNMMAAAGSDFNLVQRRRVMDISCRVVRNAELPYVNGSVRVDRKTGFIDERDAQSFEATVNSQLRAAVVATGMASDSTVVMNRTTNILATNTEAVSVRILPLAYLKTINTNIGFVNPAALAV